MRLYNAQSCTPMATTNSIRSTPSFPPQGFLPSPKKKRSVKVQRSDIKRAILQRYQPGNHGTKSSGPESDSSRKEPWDNSFDGDDDPQERQRKQMFFESRDDQETLRECDQNGALGRDVSNFARSGRRFDPETHREECRECSLEPDPPVSIKVLSTKEEYPSSPAPKLDFETIPEALPLTGKEKHVGTKVLSYRHKKNAKVSKTKKRNSAFHSPLRIAKYSFHSPPPRSQRTLSTDSTLDLVFSPSDSPQISKNETSTTAATSEVGPVRSDASESFLFDIEVVKSDPDSPAKLLESGSVISKSSSSTLTSKLTMERSTADMKYENPFDELEQAHHDSRSLFSPIRWKPEENSKATSTDIVRTKLTLDQKPSDASKKESVDQKPSIFESAWLQKQSLSGGFSEDDSWIDFTNDPFKSHTSTSLQRPFPTRANEPATVSRNQSIDVEWTDADGFISQTSSGNHEDGFIVNKACENRTMEHYSSRQSNSGASEISFPSLSAGCSTWYQVESLDERDNESKASLKLGTVNPPSTTQVSAIARDNHASRLLGSVLQERFQAIQKASRAVRGRSVPVNSTRAMPIDEPSGLRAASKPPLRPKSSQRLAPTSQKEEFATTAGSDAPTVEIAKYVKMLGMGIPAEAVKNTMTRDGVDVALLFRTEASSAEPQRRPTSGTRPDKGIRHFRIHWEPHNYVGANTLWSRVARDERWLNETIRVDKQEFSQLFRQEQMPFSPRQSFGTASSSIRVIDPKRANNGGIALSQIKLSFEHTAQAIDRLDCSALTLDQMKSILPYLPTAEEATNLRESLRNSATADWFRCECEKFMVAMLRVQDAEQKLQHMIFMETFPDLSEELKKDAILVQRACQEVMSSQNFRRVLALILSLGNRVNNEAAGHSSNSAGAIRLDSLIALHQSKTFDRQTTFLQYAASLLRKHAPETLDWKQDDMPSLRRAHKVKWKVWLAEFELIKGKLNALRARCLQTSQVLGCSNATSSTTARLSNPVWQFVCQAEAKFATLREEGDKGTKGLESLWQYFGETCSNTSRIDSVLGTLVLFAHQWEQAVEHAVRLERESRRRPKSAARAESSEQLALSPSSSKASQHSPFLSASQSYGHDV